MEPFTKSSRSCFVLLLVLAAALAAPLSWQPLDNQCASRCRADPQLLSFTPGKSYSYQLRTQTFLEGARQQNAEPLALEATVVVSARSPCDLALELSETRVLGANSQAQAQLMQSQLEAEPLFFGYDDGQVTDVCPAPEDSQWALNVKKAIVSALQMSASSLQKKSLVEERDFLGTCTTTYTPVSSRYGKTVIARIKNLRNCRDNQQWLSGIFPRAYSKYLQSIPIMNGSQECAQNIAGDLIEGATCRETQSLFNLRVVSELNLRLARQTSNEIQIQSFGSKVKAIRRHHNHLRMTSTGLGASSSSQELIPALRSLCQALEAEDQQKRALSIFPELVQLISHSSTSQVQKAWQSVQKKDVCQSNKIADLFLDACAQSGSSGAAHVLVDWFKKSRADNKNGIQTEIRFQSLAFCQEPSEEALELFIQLFKEQEIGNHVLLGISAFIHNAKHAKNLDQSRIDRAADQAIDFLLKKTSSSTPSAIVAIKALQNIGLEKNARAQQQLAKLARESSQLDGLRVAALHALSEAMSEQQTRSQVIDIVKSESERNEVRIAGYLAIVKSGASEHELQQIQQVTQATKNEHVQQYIRSHQKNVRESSDPHKQELQKSAQSVKFAEPRKQWVGVSYNMEGSFLFEALGVGLVAEMDVVHEAQQTLPKAVTFNATLPLFGRELNLVALQVRQRGLSNLFNNINYERPQQAIGQLLEIIARPNQWFKSNDNKAFLEVHMHVDGKIILTFDSRDQQRHQATDLIRALSKCFQETFEGALAWQPVAARVELPSTGGWPLIARINSTLLAQIKTRADQQSVRAEPALNWQMEAAVEVRAGNEQGKQVGVKVNAGSWPEWNVKWNAPNDRNVHVQVQMDKQRITIFQAEADLFSGQPGQSQPQSQQQWKKCTQYTKKPLGVVFCVERASNGIQVYLEKSDQSLKSLEMQYKREPNHVRLMLNTPNSQIDRHVEAELQWENSEHAHKSAKVNVRSPWARFSSDLIVKNEEKEQSVSVHVQKDGQQLIVLDLGVEMTARGQKREYRPRVRVQVGSEREAINLQGTVGISKGRKNQLQINLEGNQKQFLKGSFVREGERKSADIRVSTDLSLLVHTLEMRVLALLDKGPKHLTSDLSVEYRARGMAKKESAKMSVKVQNLTQSQMLKMSAFGEFISTQYPQMNCHVAYNLLHRPSEHVENELTLQWDQKLSKKVHVLHVSKLSAQNSQNTLNVEITPLKVDYELRASGQKQQNEVSAELVGKDRTGSGRHEFKANFLYKHVSRAPLHMTLAANLRAGDREWEYQDDLQEVRENEYKGKTELKWGKAGDERSKQVANMQYDYKTKKGEVHHEVALMMTSPWHAPFKHTALLRSTRHEKHFKTRLTIDGDSERDYGAEAFVSRSLPSRFECHAGQQYAVRARAQPYVLPQSASLEVVAPSGEHKTYVESLPQNYLKIKSDTKRRLDGQNIFALESEIARQTPSKVHVISPAFEARATCHLSPSAERRNVNVFVKRANNEWTHESQYEQNPSEKTIQIKSKTIGSDGQPIVAFESLLNSKQKSISLEIPSKKTSVSAALSQLSRGQRAANLNIACGPKFSHVTNFESSPSGARFSSKQTDIRSVFPAFGVNYSQNYGEDEHQMAAEVAQNYALECAARGLRSGIGHVTVEAKGKRENAQHKTKLVFDANQQNYQIESQTKKLGENLAQISANIYLKPERESQFKVESPSLNALLVAVPSSGARIRVHAPSYSHEHVAAAKWSPNLALDCKSIVASKVYALAAKHDRALKQSFASFKSPAYDLSGQLLTGSERPMSSKVTYSSPRYNHVTEVEKNHVDGSVRVQSKTDRKSSDSVIASNVYALDGAFSPSAERASQIDVSFGQKMKLTAKAQPFVDYNNKRFVNWEVEHPEWTHATQLEAQANKGLSLRSRTSRAPSGSNLAKLDVFVAQKDKSHVTFASPLADAHLEYLPNERARAEFKSNQWVHKTSIGRSGEGVAIESKTLRANDNQNVFSLNSNLNPWNAPEASHVQIMAPSGGIQVAKVVLHPSASSASFSLKTPKYFHKSDANWREMALDSQTTLDDAVIGQLKVRRDQLQVEAPQFKADALWQPSAHQMKIKYESKLIGGRHILAAVRARDDNGYHCELAWDLQKNPDQRVDFDFTSQLESESSGSLWANNKRLVTRVLIGYAGNDVTVESRMTRGALIAGPHEWRVQYEPKYEKQRDALSLTVKHEIKNKEEMQCELIYSEGQRETLNLNLKSKLEANQLVASLTSRADNKQLEGHVEAVFRVQDLKKRNAQIFAEVKALRASERHLVSVDVKRVSAQAVKGVVKVETPSQAKQMDVDVTFNDSELRVSAQTQDGEKAELVSTCQRKEGGEVRAALWWKSNLPEDVIPVKDIEFQYNYIPRTELSISLDKDGQRKAELSFVRSSSYEGGDEVIARAYAPFLSAWEAKAQMKRDSGNSANYELFVKYEQKEVFSAVIEGKKERGAWQGSARVSQNGAEVAKAALEASLGRDSANYIFNAKSRDLAPIKVQFSVQTDGREKKATVSACSNSDECVEAHVGLKWSRGHSGLPVERVDVSIGKVGTNVEFQMAVDEQLDIGQSRGQSLLGVTSGERVQWRRRNQLAFGINGHRIGAQLISAARGNNQREDQLEVEFPNQKTLRVKSDALQTSSGRVTHKVQVEDSASQEPLLSSQLQAQNDDSQLSLEVEVSARKFRKSPKKFALLVKKGNPVSVKVELDAGQNPQKALVLDILVNQKNSKRSFSYSSDNWNQTFSFELYSKDRKSMDLQLKGHVASNTIGFQVRNLARAGHNQNIQMFVELEPISGQQRSSRNNEQRFKGMLIKNDQKYSLEGAFAKNEQEWSARYRVTNEKSGRTKNFRAAIDHKCVTWEARAEQNRKLELCANTEDRKDRSLQITLEETSGAGKARHFSANIELDARADKTLNVDVDWSPETLKKWLKSGLESETLNGLYSQEWQRSWEQMSEEVSHKSRYVAQQVSDDVIMPLATLFSDEFSDVIQELAQKFEYISRAIQVSRQLVQQLEESIQSALQQIERWSPLQRVSDTWQRSARAMKRTCKHSEPCYRLMYAVDNYGWESTSDWLKVNAINALRSTHRVIARSSGRLQTALSSQPIVQSAQEFFQQYLASLSERWLQPMIDGNRLLRSMVDSIEELFAELQKDFDQIKPEKVKELVKDIAKTLFLSAPSSSRVVTWDPERGRAQFQIKSDVIASNGLQLNDRWDKFNASARHVLQSRTSFSQRMKKRSLEERNPIFSRMF